jgi:hypothetical protein
MHKALTPISNTWGKKERNKEKQEYESKQERKS